MTAHRVTFVLGLSLLVITAQASTTPCWIVSSWWNPKSCKLTSDASICNRGWNTYSSEAACCGQEFPGTGCDNNAGPAPSPTTGASEETAAPTEARGQGSCNDSGSWPDCRGTSSGPCKNVDGIGAPLGFCFQAMPGTDEECWPGTEHCQNDDDTKTLPPTPAPTNADPETTSPTPPPPTPGGTDNAVLTPEPTAPPPQPTQAPTQAPTTPGGSNDELPQLVKSALQSTDYSKILLAQQPDLSWAPSTIYFWPDFLEALRVMHTEGINGQSIWLGDESSANGWKYGMVSVAAFLAQTMKETIKYDACDENNWDSTTNYPASNACGQLGQSYQDYNCPAGEEHMQCEVDPDMMIRANTHAKWYGAPAAFYCAPKTLHPKSPRWSYSGAWCAPNAPRDLDMTMDEYLQYIVSDDTCRDYEGQKDGEFTFAGCGAEGCGNAPAPLFGKPEPRTDVEGCCWWGRGVIQTTGICNFGKLNYFLGARAAREGRGSLFPTVDFCKDPQAICSSSEFPQLKWIAGLFYWLNSVQSYSSGGWVFQDQVKAFVDSGGVTGTSLIDGVSGIVNRGCHTGNCGTGPVDGLNERRQNLQDVLEAMGLFQ